MDARKLLLDKAVADLNKLQDRRVGFVNHAQKIIDELKEVLESKLDEKQVTNLLEKYHAKIVNWITDAPEATLDTPAFRKALFRVLAVLAINESIRKGEEEPTDPYSLVPIMPDDFFVTMKGHMFDINMLAKGIQLSGEWKNIAAAADFLPAEQEAIREFAADKGISLAAKDLADSVTVKSALRSEGVAPPTLDDQQERKGGARRDRPHFVPPASMIDKLADDTKTPVEELRIYQREHPRRFESVIIASPYIKERLLSVDRAKNLTEHEASILALTLFEGPITKEILTERMQMAGVNVDDPTIERKISAAERKSTPPPQTSPKAKPSSGMPEADSDILVELSKATGRSTADLINLKQTSRFALPNLIKLLPYFKEGLLESKFAEHFGMDYIDILRLDNAKDQSRATMLERMEIAGIAPPIPDQKHQIPDSKRRSSGPEADTKNAGVEIKSNTPAPRAKTPPPPAAPEIDPVVKQLSEATKITTAELLNLKNTSPQEFKKLETLLPYLRESKFTADYARGLEDFQVQLLTQDIEFKIDSPVTAALMDQRMGFAAIPIPAAKSQDDRKAMPLTDLGTFSRGWVSNKEKASPTRTDEKRQDDSKEGYIKRLTDFITAQQTKPKEPAPQWYQVWQRLSTVNTISSEINQSAATKMIALINGQKPEITAHDFDAFKSGELGKIIADMKSKEKLPAEFLSQEKMYALQTRRL